jgi:hypothetical protein
MDGVYYRIVSTNILKESYHNGKRTIQATINRRRKAINYGQVPKTYSRN